MKPAVPSLVGEAPPADVCFLLEGTYPYVAGGVSAWVDQLIRGMPDLTFALFYLGSQKSLSKQPHYTVPSNVVSLTEVYLYDKLEPARLVPGKLPARRAAELYERLAELYTAPDIDSRLERFWTVLQALDAAGKSFTFGNLCRDHAAWELQLKIYQQIAGDESFIDFFWTTRFLHQPIFQLLDTRSRLPRAKVYHGVTTGYAGLIGAIAARQFNAPYLITEHGIYTNERLAEISRADWIYEAQQNLFSYADGLSTFKRIWTEFFFFLARIAYESSDLILTLFQGNARMQIDYGAAPEKIQILPNGIDPARFDAVRQARLERLAQQPQSRCVGFIGRVVTIKDVKTLLRAARISAARHPDIIFKIIGPTNEEPGYFEECSKMVTEFGLQRQVQFLGNQNILNILHELDIIVLTSLSEGLPLVILEGFAAGIPMVATDVGACRELVHGRAPEDQALGPAGLITRVSAPNETAQALEDIFSDRAELLKMGEAGRRRAEKYYTQKALLERYHSIYTDHSWSKRTTPSARCQSSSPTTNPRSLDTAGRRNTPS